MVINYQEVYVRLHLKVNRVNEKKQARLSKNISKLQEWFENELRNQGGSIDNGYIRY